MYPSHTTYTTIYNTWCLVNKTLLFTSVLNNYWHSIPRCRYFISIITYTEIVINQQRCKSRRWPQWGFETSVTFQKWGPPCACMRDYLMDPVRGSYLEW